MKIRSNEILIQTTRDITSCPLLSSQNLDHSLEQKNMETLLSVVDSGEAVGLCDFSK